MYVTTWPISKRGNKWDMLSYEAWTDGRTAVCHNKPVFVRAYKNEWPISWNYEYIIFGQIIFQNFHQSVKSHKGNRVSMTHHVIDIEAISTLPDEVLTIQTKCSKHPDFIMDFFCNQHHVICCRKCMSEDHRSCDKVMPLEMASNNAKRLRFSMISQRAWNTFT